MHTHTHAHTHTHTHTHTQVGAHSLDAGIHGAYYNVRVNMKHVADGDYVAMVTKEVETLVSESEEKRSAVLRLVEGRDK